MGILDSWSVLRYGHVYDSRGGMEQYLSDLNRVLLERNGIHTIQVELTSKAENVGETNENVGLGKLTRVSLFVPQTSHEQAVAGGKKSWIATFKTLIKDRFLFAPVIYPILTRPRLRSWKVPKRAGEPENVGATLESLHQRYPLNLICLHSAGGADASDILRFARLRSIPVVYIHHFSNDRLIGPSISSQLERIEGIAGVTGTEVPLYLRNKFRNVADGIDTDFFSRERSCRHRETLKPLIFLPARIVRSKGQAELIRAVGILRRSGLKFTVALAGRTDSPEFLQELKELIELEGLSGDVELLGQLEAKELRDWYGAASILAFPTQHHEGLPRTLLECQSMEVPAVVFDVGGTREGIKDGQTGFLVRGGDLRRLVGCMRVLLTNAPLREQMGKAGREFIKENFSLSALAIRHEQFYTQTVAARKTCASVTAQRV